MITKTIIDQCYLILFFIFRKGVRFSFITFSSDVATETILKLTGDRYIWSSLIVGTVINNIPECILSFECFFLPIDIIVVTSMQITGGIEAFNS